VIPVFDLPGRVLSGAASVLRGARGLVEDVALAGVRQLVQRGQATLDAGRAGEAVDVLSGAVAVLKMLGRQAEHQTRTLAGMASSLLGQAAVAGGDTRRGEHAFQEAIRAFEDSETLEPEEWSAFAVALHGARLLDRAIDAQRAVVRSGPADAGPGLRLAAWLREADRDDEARALLHELVARFPDDPDPAAALADLLAATGSDEADRAHRVAGSKLLSAGRFQEALRAFDRVSESLRRDPGIVRDTALALAELGRARDAAAELDRVIGRSGDESQLRLQKAAALVAAGDPLGALDELARVGLENQGSAEAAEIRGRVWHALGEYEKAAPELEAAISSATASAQRHALLGDTLHRLGRDTDAVLALDRAVELDPANAVVRHLRGAVLLELGQLDPAVADLRHAVALNAGWAEAWTTYGEALLRKGKLDAAVGALERALENRPDDVRTLTTLGRALAQQRRLTKAAERLEHAVRIDPSSRRAQAALGEVLVRLGRHDEALTALRSATRHPRRRPAGRARVATEGRTGAEPAEKELPDPERAESLVLMAEVFEGRGDFGEAAKALLEAAGLAPDAALMSRLAEDLRNAGRLKDALAWANRVLKLDSRHSAALTTKGATLAALGREQEAIVTLEHAVDAHPESASALSLLGDLYNRAHRIAEAEAAFRRAVALQPDDLAAQRGLGDVLRQAGQPDAAREALERALVLSPSDRLTHRLLGYTLLAAQRPDEALMVFHRALDAAPDDSLLMTDVVNADLALEDYEAALTASDQAIRADPRSPAALVCRGRALCLVGDFEGAGTVLRTAVDVVPADVEARAWLGWALENQGPDHLGEALALFESVLALYDHPSYRKELATVLWNLGDPRAAEEFQRVLATVDRRGQDPDELSIAGWCLYGLDRFDEAIEIFRRSLRLSGGSVETLFDLALAQLCDPDRPTGTDDYRRALHRAERKPRLRRRGLLRVALAELDDALRVRALSGEDVLACRGLVVDALQKVEAEATTEMADLAEVAAMLDS
jgi:tetratricopeptide (TPR) repeat protein